MSKQPTQNREVWFPSEEAIKHLNKIFHLATTGNEQDWEVELSDSSKLSEFITYYETMSETEEIKSALMALIISSFEDSLWQNEFDTALWNRAKTLIKKDFLFLEKVLTPWLPGETDFMISRFILKIISEKENEAI